MWVIVDFYCFGMVGLVIVDVFIMCIGCIVIDVVGYCIVYVFDVLEYVLYVLEVIVGKYYVGVGGVIVECCVVGGGW